MQRISCHPFKCEWCCQYQLKDLPAVTEERREECKATHGSLAHKYANGKVDKTGFPLDSNHMDTLRDLWRNDNIVITRLNQGNGVVVLDKTDYVQKMTDILAQEDKFQRFGKAETCDTTLLQERALQAFLLRQQRAGKISKGVYERIRPVGASRPRMYGIPKIHKNGTPLRPIFSMVNATQHELAKWLAEVLKPVVESTDNTQ